MILYNVMPLENSKAIWPLAGANSVKRTQTTKVNNCNHNNNKANNTILDVIINYTMEQTINWDCLHQVIWPLVRTRSPSAQHQSCVSPPCFTIPTNPSWSIEMKGRRPHVTKSRISHRSTSHEIGLKGIVPLIKCKLIIQFTGKSFPSHLDL